MIEKKTRMRKNIISILLSLLHFPSEEEEEQEEQQQAARELPRANISTLTRSCLRAHRHTIFRDRATAYIQLQRSVQV